MIPYSERLKKLKPDGVQNKIMGLISEVLAIPEGLLDPDKSFSELGVNSLLAVRLLDRINRSFDLRLGVEVLFNHGDARRLAAHVSTLHSQKPVELEIQTPVEKSIAIIGYCGKFAGASDPEALWQALLEAKPLISEMPSYRSSKAARAGFLSDAERFDAAFFGLSQREAAAMDPVQRHFLEQAWSALEHAGLTRESLAEKRVGVYAGASASGYERCVPLSGKAMDAYVMTGNLASMTAARLCYFLDLEGPAVTVDTACSSSLMAVHLACQALLNGEIDIAIAGGASLFVDEKPFEAMQAAGMLSASGVLRPFDDGADGIMVSEAAACVVLKPLNRAVLEGDRIDAVIRATVSNQDGRSNGITAPSAQAQAKLLKQALQKAGVQPETIDLIESHGTGTRLGDPIEAAALQAVYGGRSKNKLRVSALKGLTGHASEAAGVSGLIAAILALNHRCFPPIVGFSRLNSHLADKSALDFSNQAQSWPEPEGHPRRAAVSSFGLSGTNVHLILEQAPVAPNGRGGFNRPGRMNSPLHDRPKPMFLLSAQSVDALERRRQQLLDWLSPEVDLKRLSNTLMFHREPMRFRWGATADSFDDLKEKLKCSSEPSLEAGEALARWLEGGEPVGSNEAADPPLALPVYPFYGPRLWGGRTLEELRTDELNRVFHEDDAWVRDHKVSNQSLLHAAILLDLCFSAQQKVAPNGFISNLVWLKPLLVKGSVQVQSLIDANDLSIRVDGIEHVNARIGFEDSIEAMECLEVEGLSLPMAQKALGPADVYLGPSFPGPDRIRADDSEALAYIEHAPSQGLMLPPALLDAAIRTAAAVAACADGKARLRFPAKLERFSVLGSLSGQGFWIKAQRRAQGPARALEQIDVKVFDAKGQPVLNLKGLSLLAATESSKARPWRVVWKNAFALRQGLVECEADWIVADKNNALALLLNQAYPSARRLDFEALNRNPAASGLKARARIWFIAADDQDRSLSLLKLFKALSEAGLKDQGLVIRIVTSGALGEMPVHSLNALCLGLGKAASREFPSWRIRLIDHAPSMAIDDALMDRLLTDPGCPLGEPVMLHHELRLTQRLEAMAGAGDSLALDFKPGSHVIILGGMGRLGRIVSRHLSEQYGIKLSLMGRSTLDEERSAFLSSLNQADYFCVDITDRTALERAIDSALAAFGPASLLIQAVVDPVFARIERADLFEFEKALAPKVKGLINLGELVSNKNIKALTVFSSIGAFAGFPANDGQASYCAACSFEASHARRLTAKLKRPVRVIHWGLWQSEDFPPEALAQMQAMGLYAMNPTEIGEALESLLAAPYFQTVYADLSMSAWSDMGATPLEGMGSVWIDAAKQAIEASAQTFQQSFDPSKASRTLAAMAKTGLSNVLYRSGFDALKPIRIDKALGLFPHPSPLPEGDSRRALSLALLNMGMRHGLLVKENGWIHFKPASEIVAVESSPDMAAAVRLLQRCLAALPDVLNGAMTGTEVLFPGGSMEWVEPIYKDQPILANCSRLIGEAVVAAVSKGATRILEIGAGTGSTTAPVLKALQEAGHVCHYLYTDVSKAFVKQGQNRFGDLISTATLDISRAPLEQGIETGCWDIVIASNVLHATPDMRSTLRHVKSLLSEGGIVLINEMVVPDDFATLTFGLLEGWWEAQDLEFRLEDGPILGIDAWKQVLHSVGLKGRLAYDHRGLSDQSEGGQSILLAFNPFKAQASSPVRPAAAKAQAASVGIETMLRQRLAAILDMAEAQIERDRPFMEIGVDSLIAPQIAEEIASSFGISMRVTDIYKFGNLSALSAHIQALSPEIPNSELIRPEPTNPPLPPGEGRGEGLYEAIAIIGLSARFAGAKNLDDLWNLLIEGRNGIKPVDRFDIEPWFDPAGGAGKTYARSGGFLEDFDGFDPYFFNITPAEAELMDPQQRVLMEEAWKAIEHAGLDPETLSGSRCGLFIGASSNNYDAPGSPGLRTLGNSMAILSARMAYVLNLRGPNFPIDTGCSSSLVALHQACQSLRSGECDLALAGGVSVNLISPDIFLYLSDAGMASKSGESRTFDDAADGFVPGEGVGVVVLKRLSDALAQHDRIDAIIKGSAINQDGRTAGLTAPSQDAQTALALDVYRKFDLNPESFGMIEAHGTGTRLGDPIEVQALSDAFGHFTQRKGGCAIGSIKTNIGHTMAAAGMAGIAKLVLALRHKQIPASLNFSKPNAHIDFENSPFFVPTQTMAWPEGRALRGAVSSFGFSGTNAHIVLEAFPHPDPLPEGEGELRCSRRDSRGHDSGPWLFVLSAKEAGALNKRLIDLARYLRQQETDLAGVSETLASGRAHWRYRLAFVSSDALELAAQLEKAAAQPSFKPIASDHIQKRVQGSLDSLKQAYEAGDMPDWKALFKTRRPPLELPTYPFLRERFWAMASKKAASGYEIRADHVLLRAHRVGSMAILPGTLALELLRGDAQVLSDVLWLQTLSDQDTPTCLRVEGQGRLELKTLEGKSLAEAVRESLGEIPSKRLHPGGGHAGLRLEGFELYARFKAAGFDYGEILQVIEWVEIGEGFAFSQLMPRSNADALILSAVLLDGALQTAAAIGYASHSSSDRWVPYSLGALKVLSPLDGPCNVYAWLEPMEDSDTLRFGVEISDEQGRLLAVFEQVQARRLIADASQPRLELHEPIWLSAPFVQMRPMASSIAWLGEDEALKASLQQRFSQANWHEIDIDAAGLAEDLAALPGPLWLIQAIPDSIVTDKPKALANALNDLDPLPHARTSMRLAQSLIAAGRPDGALLLTAMSGEMDHPHYITASSIAGLYRTLRLEAPMISSRVLICRQGSSLADAIVQECLAEDEADPFLRHGFADSRQVQAWRALETPEKKPLPIGSGAVLISGGLGGIGLELAKRLAGEGTAKIALLGRSAPNEQALQVIQSLEQMGAAIMTLEVDVSDQSALTRALNSVRYSLGPISAVYHLAGVLKDGFLLNKPESDLNAVFSAKVRGALLLDLLTRQETLEAFVLFGSTSAVFGSIGQADYAAANAFLQAFAAYRQAKVGKTLCIDWPLWAEGGMQPSADALAYLNRLGFLPMQASLGFDLIGACVSQSNALALYGLPGLFRRMKPQKHAIESEPVDAFQYLCGLLSEFAKLPKERIEADMSFDELGIDSIMIMKLNQRMEADLGAISKTLFFEYKTPGSLAEHLAQLKGMELLKRTVSPIESEVQPEKREPLNHAYEPIAIVGISGLYPKSNDLDRFWENLRSGLDCIEEIPESRWPLEGFYHPDIEKPETSHCKWGGFIDDADCFDSKFFGISPLEAETIDPQARKFMEVCWNALEDAGIDPDAMFDGLNDRERLRRSCGVFVGVMYGDYQLFGPEEKLKGNLIGPNADYWNIANRVSAFLDLHGPSLAVDTACSSSLSAIHLACQAIRAGDCSMAIAGGVNLCLHPRRHWILSKAGMAASDGRCHSFGAGGDGYVPGEGIGAVILKPLAQAKADGDRIQGVILGSALNHGGRTSGYTVPNPVAQGDVIFDAIKRSSIDPGSISYIEAHGTGTPLGDPIEIRGLARAFDADCAIGSVKANIGHLESAAGIAGLTKVLLQMREKTLVATPHSEKLNPNLDFTGTRFRISTRSEPWLAKPMRAGISSFGAGGANAHLIVESFEAPLSKASSGPCLFLISAPDEVALKRRALQLSNHLMSEKGMRQSLHDIAHTLALGRKHFNQRLALIADAHETLAERLKRFAAGENDLQSVWSAQAQKHAMKAQSTDLSEIAKAWVLGAQTPDVAGCRIDLPAYPFAKRRLWVKRSLPMRLERTFKIDQAPMLDHAIGGKNLLPGASSLLLALELSQGALSGISWPSAGLADAEGFLNVSVQKNAEKISVQKSDATLLLEASDSLADEAPEAFDVEALSAVCSQIIEAQSIYQALAKAGADYGPSLQALETVYRGDGVCLAQLKSGLSTDAVLDAAFQLSFALIPGHLAGLTLLPASLGSIQLDARAAPSGSQAPAWEPGASTSQFPRLENVSLMVAMLKSANDQGIAVDFQLLDAEGGLIGWLSDFQAKAVKSQKFQLSFLKPEWTPVRIDLKPNAPRKTWLLSESIDDALTLALSKHLSAEVGDFESMEPADLDEVLIVLGGTSNSLKEAALRTERLLQALLPRLQAWSALPKPPELLLITREAHGELASQHSEGSPGAAAAAFMRAAVREHQNWKLVCLDLPEALWRGAEIDASILDAISNAGSLASDVDTVPRECAWRDGLILQRVLAPMQLPVASMPWKEGDVLLIAGSGGLSGLLARHVGQSAKVSVAFLGRKPEPNSETLRALQTLEAMGRRALYLCADLTDEQAVADAVKTTVSKLGPIGWLVHTALVMQDAPLRDLTSESLSRVLAPKSLGLAHLVDAVRPLRGMICFSSSNALTANPGQAAYAGASAFIDAACLNLPYPVHVIDWGFWGETGAVADAHHQAHLSRLGVFPIQDLEGLDALERVMGAGVSRAAVLRVDDRLLEPMGVDSKRRLSLRQAKFDKEPARKALAQARALQKASERFTDPDIAVLNAFAANGLYQTLTDLGVGSNMSADVLARFLDAKPDYIPLMHAFEDMLKRAGLIDAQGFCLTEAMTPDQLKMERAGLEADSPAVVPTLDLMQRCLKELHAIVKGQKEAAHVLFQTGDSLDLESVYRGNPVIDHFQKLTAAAVRGGVESLQKDVQIVEVGAGTGATTGFVLDALKGLEGWRYKITDLSASLAIASAKRLDPEGKFLEPARLDVTKDLNAQGMADIDIMIAANVLHATPDLFAVLNHVKRSLKPGGLLILNEATSLQDVNTVTFGLTPGWWAFEDAERRCPHAPLLDKPRWLRLLAEAGFQVVGSFGLPLIEGHEHGLQTVIIAQADGFISDSIQPEIKPEKKLAALEYQSSDLEESLRSLVSETLRLEKDELGLDESFADHGADSILSVELVRRINAAYRIDLKSTALFNYSTVRELSRYMASELGVAMAESDDVSQKIAAGKQRTRRLLDVINRRREAAPINQEAEFWKREGKEAKQTADIDDVLRRLELGQISVTEAMELDYADE